MKIPLAGDAIMLGVNQGIIMVLAVVVIGGLVGSGGLGYEVAQGLVRGQFGQGVIASIAILALGIALDRVTQGSRGRARKERLRDDTRRHTAKRRDGCRIVSEGDAPASRGSCSSRSQRSRSRQRSRRRRGRRPAATSSSTRTRGRARRANVYVAKYVLEKRLGCKVKVTNITEGQPSFQAMADGKIDVVLEDWDRTCPSHAVRRRAKSVVSLGHERDHRRHRLVHPALPAQAVPGVEDVAGHQGQGVRLQVAGVGVAGDVPRR